MSRKLIVTQEQRDVVMEMAKTHSQWEIAKRLGMNQATVSRCIGETGSRRNSMSEKFVVEKGIPLPAKILPRKWVLPELAVGDSFVVPSHRAVVALNIRAGEIGQKCAHRKLANGTYRIWRVE